MAAREVAKELVDAIDEADLEQISDLMTEDFLFIDSDGTVVKGREKMREGWESYLSMVPDYRITIAESFAEDNRVIFVGTASGTFVHAGELRSQNHWRIPAAWRAVVRNEKVAVWQIYLNPQPMKAILARLQSG